MMEQNLADGKACPPLTKLECILPRLFGNCCTTIAEKTGKKYKFGGTSQVARLVVLKITFIAYRRPVFPRLPLAFSKHSMLHFSRHLSLYILHLLLQSLYQLENIL